MALGKSFSQSNAMRNAPAQGQIGAERNWPDIYRMETIKIWVFTAQAIFIRGIGKNTGLIMENDLLLSSSDGENVGDNREPKNSAAAEIMAELDKQVKKQRSPKEKNVRKKSATTDDVQIIGEKKSAGLKQTKIDRHLTGSSKLPCEKKTKTKQALAKIKQEPMDDSDDCQHRSTSRKANTGRKSANAEFSDPDDDSEKESDDEDLDVPKGTKPGKFDWIKKKCSSLLQFSQCSQCQQMQKEISDVVVQHSNGLFARLIQCRSCFNANAKIRQNIHLFGQMTTTVGSYDWFSEADDYKVMVCMYVRSVGLCNYCWTRLRKSDEKELCEKVGKSHIYLCIPQCVSCVYRNKQIQKQQWDAFSSFGKKTTQHSNKFSKWNDVDEDEQKYVRKGKKRAPEPITESSSSDDEEIMPKGKKVKKSTNFIDEF